LAASSQIDGHDLEMLGECRNLVAPAIPVIGEAVDQNDERTNTLGDVVNLDAARIGETISAQVVPLGTLARFHTKRSVQRVSSRSRRSYGVSTFENVPFHMRCADNAPSRLPNRLDVRSPLTSAPLSLALVSVDSAEGDLHKG